MTEYRWGTVAYRNPFLAALACCEQWLLMHWWERAAIAPSAADERLPNFRPQDEAVACVSDWGLTIPPPAGHPTDGPDALLDRWGMDTRRIARVMEVAADEIAVKAADRLMPGASYRMGTLAFFGSRLVMMPDAVAIDPERWAARGNAIFLATSIVTGARFAVRLAIHPRDLRAPEVIPVVRNQEGTAA